MISPNLVRSRFQGRVRDDLCVVNQQDTLSNWPITSTTSASYVKVAR